VTVILAALLAGCASPTVDPSNYRTKVHDTAAAMISEINTATLTAHAWRARRVTTPYADTVVSNAESSAGTIASVFDSRQPPSEGSSSLKEKIDGPLQSATSALTDLRIALRRGDRAQVDKAVQDLRKPLRQFTSLQEVTS
jgi:hypothetical protein